MKPSQHVTHLEPGIILQSDVADGTSRVSNGRKSNDRTIKWNKPSTSDDASSTSEEENIEYILRAMPQKVKSRHQDRRSFPGDMLASEHYDEKSTKLLPSWVRMQENPKTLANKINLSRQRRYSGESKWTLDSLPLKSLKKCSSTGDLRKIGNEKNFGSCRRFLPDPLLCQKITNQENVDITDTEMPSTPNDRKTLEAQFKLLYCENVKLDRAYSDLQLSYQTKCKQPDSQSMSMSVTDATLSSPREKTENDWKEAIKSLREIKNEEISRLSDQVAYWMDHAKLMSRTDLHVEDGLNETKHTKSANLNEKVAELEQSEAQLKHQILNLEDQLSATKFQLALSKTQSDGSGVADAEKCMLDDLKQQNGNFRIKLANSEKQIETLERKLTQLADEKADIEYECSRFNKDKDNMSTDSQTDLIKLEVEQLKVELSASNDRCAGLEDVKECLIEQIKSLEDEIKVFGEQSDRIKELSDKIRILNNEKAEIVDSHDQLQLNKDLNADMTKKLNQRIEDLQGHIETLKSQMDCQKNKIISFDEIREQLEEVKNEKFSLETTCKQLKHEKHEIKTKLTDQQKTLSESFERANTQLMIETNEMATRQRDLLTDIHALKVRSQTRGVEAIIGKDFIQSIKKMMHANEPIFVNAYEAINASKNIPLFNVEDINQDKTMLDQEAKSKLSSYIKDVDGLSLQLFVDEQNMSPRVDGIVSVSQLCDYIKDCDKICSNISIFQLFFANILQIYSNSSTESPVSNVVENCGDDVLQTRRMHDEVNELKNENERVCKLNDSLIFKNEELHNQLDMCKNSSIDSKSSESLTAELLHFKRNSENLNAELEDSKFTCNLLSEKLIKMQERQLIESEESSMRKEQLSNLELAFLETKGLLEELKNENFQSKFLAKVDEMALMKENYNKENDNLVMQLQQIADSKLGLEKELDSKENEEIKLNDVINVLKIDYENAQKMHCEEILGLQNIITGNASTLLRVQKDFEEAKKKIIDYEEEVSSCHVENLSKSCNVSTAKCATNDNVISQECYDILLEKNSELKIKLDEVKNENASLVTRWSDKMEEKDKYIETVNEELKNSNCQVSQIKRLEIELEKSLVENTEMKEEIKVLIQLHKQENLSYSTEEKTYINENKKLSNRLLELEKQLIESEGDNLKNQDELIEKNNSLDKLLKEFEKLKSSIDEARESETQKDVVSVSLETKLSREEEKEEEISHDEMLNVKLEELRKINYQLVEENSMISTYFNNLLLTEHAAAEFGSCPVKDFATKFETLSSSECLQCRALSCQVECLREKHLKLQNDPNKVEKSLLIGTSKNICIAEQKIEVKEHIHNQQTSMETTDNIENDRPSVLPSYPLANLSTKDSNFIELAADKSQSPSELAEENAKLLETIDQLNSQLLSHSLPSSNLRMMHSQLDNVVEKQLSHNTSNKYPQNTIYGPLVDFSNDSNSDLEAERKWNKNEPVIENSELLDETLQLKASGPLACNEIKNENKRIYREYEKKQSEIQDYKIVLGLKENQLQEILTQKADLEETTIIQQQEIKNFMIKIDEMSINTCKLMNTLEQKDVGIANLTDNVLSKSKELEILSLQVTELKETIDALKSTMENADDIILEREKGHNDEVEDLKQGLNKTISELMSIKNNNGELVIEIACLEKQNQELFDKVKALKNEEGEVALDIEGFEMERALLNTNLNNAREDADDLLQRNQILSSINNELERDMVQLQSTIKTLDLQIFETRKNCEEIEIVANNRLIENKEINRKCAELEHKINSKIEESTLASPHVFDMEYMKDERILKLENDLEIASHELDQTKSHLEQLKIEKENLKKEIIETSDHQIISLSSQKSCVNELMQENISRNGDSNSYDCGTSNFEENILKGKILYLEDQISQMKHQVPKLELHSITGESDRSHLNLLNENKLLKRNITELKETLNLTTEELVPMLDLYSVSADTDRVDDFQEENSVLRQKIHHFKERILEMTDRLVPRLDLESICEEVKNMELLSAGDDTCRDVEECKIDTERELEGSKNQLKCPEKILLMQVQEIEEENENLKLNMEELTKKNENLQNEFFETIHDDFQTQMDELNELNCALKGELSERENELNLKQKQLQQISIAETQWKKRCLEVQAMAEELRLQLQKAEVNNQDLHCRLIDLDDECRRTAEENSQATNYIDNDIMELKMESCAQTLSWSALVQLINEENENKKKPMVILQNEVEDTTAVQPSSQLHLKLIAKIPDLRIEENLQNIDNDANDLDVPKNSSPNLSTYQSTTKTLQKENKELLNGSTTIMTQEDRESLEREVSALRGQVALLERNNRIFSDRERTDLKKELAASNKRCNNYQTQLLVLRRSLEFEDVEKLKFKVEDLEIKNQELQNQLDNESNESSTSESNSFVTEKEKFADEEELKQKLQEKDDSIKDRDSTIEQIKNQLNCVETQYKNKVAELEKSNIYTENELNDEISELSRQMEESKDIIKLKQSNFEKKCEQLGICETELEHLKRDIQKKENEIKLLNWEIGSLHEENKALRERINNYNLFVSNSNDPNHINYPLSPPNSVQSNSSPHLLGSKLRSPSSQTSAESSYAKRDDEPNKLRHIRIDLNTSNEDVSGGRSRSVSLDKEDMQRSALRAGILEAKQTVNDMGDVLDAPRTPLRGRSPVARQAINVVGDSNRKYDESEEENETHKTMKPHLDPKKKESLSPIRKKLNVNKTELTDETAPGKTEIKKLESNAEPENTNLTSSGTCSSDNGDKSEKTAHKKTCRSQSSMSVQSNTSENESNNRPPKPLTTSSRKKNKSLQSKNPAKRKKPSKTSVEAQRMESSISSGNEKQLIVSSDSSFSSYDPKRSQSEFDNRKLTKSMQAKDKVYLIDEITKAREEARKWFKKVEKADKEKAILAGRMKKMKSEFHRLKENAKRELKSNHPVDENHSLNIEMLRAQAEAATRKAEEARERSALLRVHLMDKEMTNLNNKFTDSTKDNDVSEENSVLSQHSNDKKVPTNSELQEIKDRFENIASNFTSLVLKKHDLELKLNPTQIKVSELRIKCLERDQLLAKLVDKISKQNNNKSSKGVESNDKSLTSVDFDEILSTTDHVVQSGIEQHDLPHLLKSEQKSNTTNEKNSDVLVSMRPPQSKKLNVTHRVYVAKKDYTPLNNSVDVDSKSSVTQCLLPDLKLLAGDTVVAIGNPDSRDDEKLYQLAEVQGKIGFVPYSHLVAAEQMEGMQSYILERGRSKRTKTPSNPTKIENLYKKLANAQLTVADRLDRTTLGKPPCRDVTNHVATKSNSSVTSLENKTPIPYNDNKQSGHDNMIENSAESSLVNSESYFSSGVRSAVSSIDVIDHEQYFEQKTENFNKIVNTPQNGVSQCSLSPHEDNNVIRTSTPIMDKSWNPRTRRSSSLPPRQRSSFHSNRSDISMPAHFFTSPSRHSKKRMTPPLDPIRKLGIPQPPSFLVIEKTMGQKSMIISWTPPVLDMISRSNNVPVIAYEISIDQQRKVQISGAYTNKAILGDLDLRKTFTIQIRTISSVGTLSNSADIIFTPNICSNHSTSRVNSFQHESPPINKILSNEKNSTELPYDATVLYDYDPVVDSPYKTHDRELKLKQGESIQITGDVRPDGFCKAKIGRKSGFVPISFLLPDSNCSFSDSTDYLTKPKVFLS